MPKSKDEVVLVLDDNNSVPLTTLYELGLLPASDYHEMMSKLNAGDKVSTPQDKIDYAKALDQTLYMIPASDQYVKGDDGHYLSSATTRTKSNSASKRPPNSRWWRRQGEEGCFGHAVGRWCGVRARSDQ